MKKLRGVQLMEIRSRRLLFSALAVLLLFTTSCNLPSASVPSDGTATPHASSGRDSVITPTAFIPVTGGEVVSLRCQFCVNGETHAVLTLPEQASFNVSEPIIGVTCLTTEIMNGQRVLLCRGAQQTTFSLNICVDSNCSQMPVTLAACPSKPSGAVQPTQQVVIAQPSPIVVTPIDTRVPRGQPDIATLTATPAVFVPLPGAATTVPAPVNPGAGVDSPEGFIRWYFNAVWQARNYQELWENYLTPNFKNKVGSGIYEDYADWWNSVDRVDVNSVDVLQNDGTHAWVRVNINFSMKDGRVIQNQVYEYSLLYDAARKTWMFD